MLLPWLILTPLIGGYLCWQIERLGVKASQWISLFSIIITLIISLLLWQQNCYALLGSQWPINWKVEYLIPWIPRFGINIHLSMDGLSLIMILMTSILGILSIVCSWKKNYRYAGLFYFNLLWILSGIIGVFLAIDLFLFLFFWEMMLIPMYFLVSLWGHKEYNISTRIAAANKFLIYTQLSGFLMLVAIIGLALTHYNSSGTWTFNYEALLHTPMSEQTEYILMMSFFISFAIKIPVIPLHGWLPDTHICTPTAGSIDIVGILIKTAAYGILRFVITLFPHASHQFAPIAIGLGLASIFYGAWMAYTQVDMKRLLSYTSISHMGFVLIAIYSGTYLAYQGIVIHIIAYSFSSAGMFIICGQIYERLHTRDLRKMGGLWDRLYFIPAMSLFFAISNLGMPGTGNFVGEVVILLGTFSIMPVVTVISTCGIIFTSIYSLIMIKRAYYGPTKFSNLLPSVTKRERFVILLPAVLLLLVGLFPQPIINTSASSMRNIQHQFNANTKYNSNAKNNVLISL